MARPVMACSNITIFDDSILIKIKIEPSFGDPTFRLGLEPVQGLARGGLLALLQPEDIPCNAEALLSAPNSTS